MTSDRYLEPESTRLSAAAPPLPSPADAPPDDLFATSRRPGIWRREASVTCDAIVLSVVGYGASEVYAATAGITQAKFMERFGKPLTPQMVAEAILTISRGEGPAGPAIAITGNSGLEAMG